MRKILETERLYLRELVPDDRKELGKVLSDPESMACYPRPFDDNEVKQWISRNIERYEAYNHGLWAVIRKKDGKFLGDCGITIQDIDGKELPEIGYHIIKDYWNNGYATEAAGACLAYGVGALGYDELYSYATEDNISSIKVAKKIGMSFHKSYFRGIEKIVVQRYTKQDKQIHK